MNMEQPHYTTSRNEHTNSPLITKPSNEKYSEGWERIFGNSTNKSLEEEKNNGQV